MSLRRLPEATLFGVVLLLLLSPLVGDRPRVHGAPPAAAGTHAVGPEGALDGAGLVPEPRPLPGPSPLTGRPVDGAGQRGSAVTAARETDGDSPRNELDPGPVRTTPPYWAEAHEPEGLGRGLLRDGRREGPWTWTRLDGSLALRGRYEQGRRVDDWTWFDEQGNVLRSARFLGDRLEGVLREFDPLGNVRLEQHYHAGLRDGPHVQHYSDGSLKERGAFRQGVRQGRWEYLLPDGRREPRSGVYVDGQRRADLP